MTGDNEHDREGAGDEPASESAEASAGGNLTPESAESGAFEEPFTHPGEEAQPGPRRFRSWAAAEEKPSIFARLKSSFGAVFRKPKEVTPQEESGGVAPWQAGSDVAASRYEGEASPDDRPWMEPRVVEEEPQNEPAETQDSIPWIAPATPIASEPMASEPMASGALDESPRVSHFGGTFFEAPTEIIPEEKPRKPGFFARLFGRKSKPQPEPFAEAVVEEEEIIATNEYPLESEDAQLTEVPGIDAQIEAQGIEAQESQGSEIEAAFEEPESTFGSVEEALPAAEEPPFASVEEALPAAEEPPLAEEPPAETFAAFEASAEPVPIDAPKPGFFSRLVKRLSRQIEVVPERRERRERPSLEIEIHDDRIAAAADALEQMGQETVSESREEPASTEPFASVDDALPELTRDERFAPPPPAPAPFLAEPEVVAPAPVTPAHSSPIGEVASDTRPTIEVTKDSRPTIEVAQDARPTMEVSSPAVDLGKTMDAGIDLGKTMDAGIDLGKTMDVVPFNDTLDVDDTLEVGKGKDKSAPKPQDIHLMFGNTLEIADDRRKEADSGAYFGDTLEPSHFGEIAQPPEEIDKDTDEYEMPIQTSAETPSAAVPDLDEDTAQVSRKSLLEKLLFWRKQQEAERPTVDGAVTMVEGNPNFLFSKFRTFYNEIIRHKHQKSEFTAGFSTAIVTDYSADLSPEGAADTLSKNLAAMLELQAAEAQWMGGESARLYADAQYAMAALADETFLHQEWEGKGAWHKHLLEVKLFRSRSADVELFKRIDKLLKDQPNSAAARDLARVYLMVIAAGFKGKYRPFGLTRALADYRQRLYEYIHNGGDALLLYAPERKIFPEATERTLVGHAIGRFTSAQRWAAILAFLLLSYTAIAHFAWSRVSADLRDVTDRIKATSTTASGNGGP